MAPCSSFPYVWHLQIGFPYFFDSFLSPDRHIDSDIMSKAEHSEESVQVKPMECTIDDSVMENTVWRKLDLYILPLASMFYFLSFLVIISLILDFLS